MKDKTIGEEQALPISSERILVAYFSWSGNTREVARQIGKMTGADLLEIVSVDTYPSDYDECVKQARRELDRGHLPELKTDLENLESYGVIFVGYPNWWGTVPGPVASFLSKCDSSGKTIVPFCTHEGTRLGRSVSDITKLCPKSKIIEALAIRGGDARRSQDDLSAWLKRIGLKRES